MNHHTSKRGLILLSVALGISHVERAEAQPVPPGTKIEVSNCIRGSRFDGMGTQFAMQVPATMQQLASNSFVGTLLDHGMQQVIDYCNGTSQNKAYDHSNRFFAQICIVPCTSAVIGGKYLISATKEIGSNKWQVTNYATAIYQRQQQQKEEQERAPIIDKAALCTFIMNGQSKLRTLHQRASSEPNPLRKADASGAIEQTYTELNAGLDQIVKVNYKLLNVEGVVQSIDAMYYSSGQAVNLILSLSSCPISVQLGFIDWNEQEPFNRLSQWRPVLESLIVGSSVNFSIVVMKNNNASQYSFPPLEFRRLGLNGLVTKLQKRM